MLEKLESVEKSMKEIIQEMKTCLNLIDLRSSAFFKLSEGNLKERGSV